jgi:hypothetical protein
VSGIYDGIVREDLPDKPDKPKDGGEKEKQ